MRKFLEGCVVAVAALMAVACGSNNSNGYGNNSNGGGYDCNDGGTIGSKYEALSDELARFVSGKDAEIGVAVIVDGTDTVSVNGSREFPMLSVYKFPIALALADSYRSGGLSFDLPIAILKEDLHADTYSPMTERFLSSSRLTTDPISLPTRELLAYMLRLSDNNASDIILRHAGGARCVGGYLSGIGAEGINVRNSEMEMYADRGLCYRNSATPIAMASLFDRFNREFNDSLSVEIKRIVESCETGTDRLAKPLLECGAVVGHKTGTGFVLDNGRIMAINDAGYVNLPNGRSYSIAVFVENSGYDMPQTSALIAEISAMVYSSITD